MPKMKTHRGAAKRFDLTATGKIKRSHAFTSHILTKKSAKRKRNLRKAAMMSAADAQRVIKLIPYK
jgi:large subunit ribosomal protein L35